MMVDEFRCFLTQFWTNFMKICKHVWQALFSSDATEILIENIA